MVLSRGQVGREMSSPGIRAYHMARVLAQALPNDEVTLAAPNVIDVPPPHPRVRLAQVGGFNLREMARHDIIISRNFHPQAVLLFLRRTFILDLFSMLNFEWMEFGFGQRDKLRRSLWLGANNRYLNLQLTFADYAIAATEHQRDHWIGMMWALGLVNPDVYERDPTLEKFVGLVPYGVRPEPPLEQVGREALCRAFPGIRPDDTVLIWNGGIVSWYDPCTAVRAVDRIRRYRDDVKLVFLGLAYPFGGDFELGPEVREAITLARDLGLEGSHVFFNFGWVPYDETMRLVQEADIGLCTAREGMEARYAYRTRFVDLIWAGLPIVCTQGDALAERVASEPWGVTVAEGDADGVVSAVLRLLDDGAFAEECRQNLMRAKDEMQWERTLEPLVDFMRNGHSVARAKVTRLPALLMRMAEYLALRGLGSLYGRRRSSTA
ncbi:MAG TPA: glycosyltransferase, partial [Dehalococcoidia bacterium]|nr:glycosyltransferase [Dehalococcoidia bacterium]